MLGRSRLRICDFGLGSTTLRKQFQFTFSLSYLHFDPLFLILTGMSQGHNNNGGEQKQSRKIERSYPYSNHRNNQINIHFQDPEQIIHLIHQQDKLTQDALLSKGRK